MTYTLTVGVALGSGNAGLTLSAQLKDTAGSNVGAAVTTGFVDLTTGHYSWNYASFPDAFRGSVTFLSAGAVMAMTEINPEEAELVGTRLPTALVGGRMDSSTGAMAANVLTAAAINADAITAAKVADGTIDAATFAAGAINAAAIATDAITAAKIAADAIGASELAADAVTEIQSGLATAAALATVQADTDNIQTRIPAALVSGRMDSSVGAMAAGTVTAAAIATDAIDADALAADAGTEIGTAVWATTTRTLTSISALAAQIASAVWDAVATSYNVALSMGNKLNAAGSAGDPWTTALPGAYGAGTAGKIVGDNINATISSRASQTSLDTVDDFLDTEIGAIKTQTDQLAFTASRVNANVGAIEANVITSTTIATGAIGGTELSSGATDAISASVWATATRALTDKAGFSLSAGGIQAIWDALTSALTTVGSIGKRLADNVDVAISGRASQGTLNTGLTDLDDIQARLPAALVSGRIDASVGAMASGVVTATAIAADAIGASELAADAVTEIQSGLATAAALSTAQTAITAIQGAVDTEIPAILAAVDTEVAAIKAKTDNLPASPAAVGSAMTLDLTQAIANGQTLGTVGDALVAAEVQGGGSWVLVGTTLTLKRRNGSTWLALTLDSASAPTSRV